MDTLDQWASMAVAELGLDHDATEAAVPVVLDLARTVAHSVARPAAPLTAFLLGVAVGKGHSLDQSAQRLRALAAAWAADA